MNVSWCVHSYNEADSLKRLVLSTLPLSDLIDEWVIVDHRSDDATAAVCNELSELLRQHNVSLTSFREERDFSQSFTFADIRNATIRACRNEIVVMLDADFIVGPAFRGFVERTVEAIGAPDSPYYGAGFTVPVIWDRLAIANGVIQEHGRVWVHNRRPRIFLRDAIHYEQVKQGGRWEKLIVDTPRQSALQLTGKRSDPLARDTVISVNVKPAARIALRDTMTMFMQDAMQGRTNGEWLVDYQAGKVRSQGEYDYQDVELTGWRLNSDSLVLP